MSTTHRGVAWAWAHQTGKEQNGHHVFYRGDVIYSYGYHWPLARLVTIDNRPFALVNCRGYSKSTARHRSLVLSACRAAGIPTIDVEDVLAPNWRHEVDRREALAQDCLAKSKRAVKLDNKLWHRRCANEYRADAIVLVNLGLLPEEPHAHRA